MPSSSLLLMLLALKVYSRGYKRVREEQVPSLWGKEWTGAESSVAAQPCANVFVISWFDGFVGQIPLMGHPAFPFIGQ